MRFEWDPDKDRTNQKKHGLSFDEAKQLFLSDNDYLEIFDESSSAAEERFFAIGAIHRGVVVVIHTERGEDLIRIISARFATRREQNLYRDYMEQQQ